MQKNSGGGEDLIRGGDIFYLGGCTPPCTPPENPPMSYRRRKPIRQLNSTIELKNSYVYIIGDVFAWCPITKLSLRCIVSASPGQ